MSVLSFELLTSQKNFFLADALGSQFNEKFKIYENSHVTLYTKRCIQKFRKRRTGNKSAELDYFTKNIVNTVDAVCRFVMWC